MDMCCKLYSYTGNCAKHSCVCFARSMCLPSDKVDLEHFTLAARLVDLAPAQKGAVIVTDKDGQTSKDNGFLLHVSIFYTRKKSLQ